jgi:nucleoside-diphosphate-sugar epimerase
VGTVVVTGTSGSLGHRVVQHLAGDAAVSRLVAVDVVASRLAGSRVQERTFDLVEGGRDLDDAVRGASAVIHLAWSHHDVHARHNAGPLGSPNHVATRRVLDAAHRAGATHLVLLSSGTVYGAWPDNPVPLPEDAPIRPNPGFPFAEEKAEAERMVAEWSDEHPVFQVAVLRPAVTVGAAGPALYHALARSAGPSADGSGRPVQFLHVDDLATAVAHVWRRGLSGVFNVAPDGWIGDDTARTLTGGVPHVGLPAPVGGSALSLGWRLARRGIPRSALPYTLHPWVLANDRLVASGWRAAHSNEEVLVSAGARARWLDLPLGRRRPVVLAGGAAGVAALGGAAAAVAAAAASRRRRPGRSG